MREALSFHFRRTRRADTRTRPSFVRLYTESMRWLLFLITVAAGCGRIGFDDTTAVASDAEVLGTTDAVVQPSSWQLAPIQGPTQTLWALQAFSPTDIWVGGTNGYIGHFDGATWSTVTSPAAGTLYIFWAISATDIWLVGQMCTLLHYQGTSWQSVVAQGCTGNKALNSIDGTAASNMWVTGEQGTILAFNGTSWTDHSQSNLSYWSIDVTSSTDVLVVGTLGTTLRWNGSTLVTETGAPNETLSSIARIGSDTWLVGGNGAIARKAGAGTWQPVASPVTSGTLYAIYAAAANDIWAVGTGGVIIHYDGTAWSQVQSPTTKTLRNITGIPGGGLVAVGDSGVVLTHP